MLTAAEAEQCSAWNSGVQLKWVCVPYVFHTI